MTWQTIGQSRATSFLQHSLERGVAHAYLFVGPPHVGKMTLALDLARALNCLAADPPCGRCDTCQKIAAGRHADIQVIALNTSSDAEDAPRAEISIEQVRQLQHSASLPPFEGRCKVYIVDGAEMLSNEAANCLLKTLEEPNERVVFVLLTRNERQLPATVVSRCQRVELRPLPAAEVQAALEANWHVEPARAQLLARLSHGCLGLAVSALDGALLAQRAERLDKLLEVVDSGYEERFAFANQMAARFLQSRTSVLEVLETWLDWWHDLLLVSAGCEGSVTSVDHLPILVGMAGRYSLPAIKSFVERIRTAAVQLRQNANPRLVFEVLMLNIPEAEKAAASTPVV